MQAPHIRRIAASPSTLLELHAARPDRYPALFASAAVGLPLGQFDILFAFPGDQFSSRGRADASSFLTRLDERWNREKIPSSPAHLPFHGGWLIYLSYELAGEIEPRLRLPQSAGPIARAIRIPAAMIYEHATGNSWLVAEQGSEELLDAMQSDIASVAIPSASAPDLLAGHIDEDPPEQYLRAVARALEYIAAGEIYQANLSRGWYANLSAGMNSVDLYRRLRETNPGPFSASAHLGELSIVSSSPERLVSIRDGMVATRPIAGTRPRGKDQTSDERLALELSSNPKERAEHIMLLDLERNDLGRVCEAGSVSVDEFMTIESYAHVHHIVSNVSGRLRAQVSPGQVLAAVFPGGTITGCPKVRCMEIIAELEGMARGAYTGSLGYLNRDGSMDFNILIRSLEVRGQTVSLRAGAGIVADSVPERELEESRAKARGVLNALSGAPR